MPLHERDACVARAHAPDGAGDGAGHNMLCPYRKAHTPGDGYPIVPLSSSVNPYSSYTSPSICSSSMAMRR